MIGSRLAASAQARGLSPCVEKCDRHLSGSCFGQRWCPSQEQLKVNRIIQCRRIYIVTRRWMKKRRKVSPGFFLCSQVAPTHPQIDSFSFVFKNAAILTNVTSGYRNFLKPIFKPSFGQIKSKAIGEVSLKRKFRILKIIILQSA